MTWLQLHWTDILTVWGVLWALASTLQGAFPVASVPSRVCHAILAVSPLDFVKAIKAMGGALVPPVAAVLLIVVVGSTSACAPAASPTVDARALARASVSLLVDAWVASAQGCLDVAETEQSDAPRAACEKVLTPARQALIAASDGIDLWTAADQRNFPCLVTAAAASVAQVPAAVPGVKLPQIVSDGLSLAQTYAGKCAP